MPTERARNDNNSGPGIMSSKTRTTGDGETPDEYATVGITQHDTSTTVASNDVPPGVSAAAPPASPAVRRFGTYELLNELARGGMGVVYRARQVSLDRIVAVKMILQGDLASKDDVVRFQREAESAARLNHPGIVQVYEVGEVGGQHFFSMSFIEGQSLQQRIQSGPVPPYEAAEIMVKVAEAIGYAHQQGVVHRDLKPANVLVDWQGEPRITDFGLARTLDREHALTRSGAVMGTPSYMPPEQAAGRSAQVGPEADIYSLGAVLYCLLTGRPPFQAANLTDTLMQVIEGDPIPPRALNPAIDADLNAICMKCLEKNPADRFSSADAFKAELTRFLMGEPVSIRSRTSLERLKRALAHSRDDQALATWGELLLVFAPVVLLAEVVVWGLAKSQENEVLIDVFLWAGVVRVVQFGLLFACSWWWRERIMQSRRLIATQMLSHWAAFAIACHCVLAAKVIAAYSSSAVPFDLYACYPGFAILSGVLWFALGSNFWGGCYVVGAMHFTSSLAMAHSPEYGPILFGLLWFLSLVMTGLRLKRIGMSLVRESGDSDSAR